MPDLLIRLGFDPSDDQATAEVFRDDTARTLYLLWRRGHIVGPSFPREVLAMARFIRESAPATATELAECFRRGRRNAMEFVDYDIDRFCPGAIGYFRGWKKVLYELSEAAEAARAPDLSATGGSTP